MLAIVAMIINTTCRCLFRILPLRKRQFLLMINIIILSLVYRARKNVVHTSVMNSCHMQYQTQKLMIHAQIIAPINMGILINTDLTSKRTSDQINLSKRSISK